MKILPIVVLLAALNHPSILLAKSVEKETFKWKVYTSTNFGFSIEYPEFAEVKEYENIEADHVVAFDCENSKAKCYFEIEIYLNSRNLPPDEFWQDVNGEGPLGEGAVMLDKSQCSKRDKRIKINNAQGLYSYCLDKIEVSENKFEKSKIEHYSFFKFPYVIAFSATWRDIKTYPPERRLSLKTGGTITRHMIDSFKFLEPDKKRNVAR